jgi:hypothetical protein
MAAMAAAPQLSTLIPVKNKQRLRPLRLYKLCNRILTELEIRYRMIRCAMRERLALRSNDFGFEIEFSANMAQAGRRREGLKAPWYILPFRLA